MNTRIITVFNQKGGCGKTTLSIHLAGTLALRGYKTLLVDMDKQGTTITWVSQGKDVFPATVISLAKFEGSAHKQIRQHVDNYDIITIDCPPAADSPASASSLLVSDLALVPFKSSPADVWASNDAKALINEMKVKNEGLIARLVPSQIQGNLKMVKELLETLRENDDQSLPVTKHYLGLRTAYQVCQLLGSTVHSVPDSTKAVQEVEALTSEILELLNLPLKKKK